MLKRLISSLVASLTVVTATTAAALGSAGEDSTVISAEVSSTTQIVAESTIEETTEIETTTEAETTASTTKNVETTTKETTVEETETVTRNTYSDVNSDIMYIATTVCEECGGSSIKSCYYVAQVIMNRVKSNEFPDTVTGVLTQNGQYAHYAGNNGRCWTNWATSEIKDKCLKAAQDAYYGTVPEEYKMPENVVYQAQFLQGSGLWLSYEGHYFCFA